VRSFWLKARTFGLRMWSCSERPRSFTQLSFHRSGKGNRCLNVLQLQARKIHKDFLTRVSCGEAGEHGAERNASPSEQELTAADLGVAEDAGLKDFRHV
jgi:hypothetical protein